MTSKLVIRLLDGAGSLLGWCEHVAAVKGDGCLRASTPIQVTCDVAGTAADVSLHWADINVDTRVPMPAPFRVIVGDVIALFPTHAPLIVLGPQAGGLPPVTTKSVAVPVPVGMLGARSSI